MVDKSISAKAVEMEAQFEKGDIKGLAAQLAETPWNQRLDLAVEINRVNEARLKVDPSLPRCSLLLVQDSADKYHLGGMRRNVRQETKNSWGAWEWEGTTVYFNPAWETMHKLDADSSYLLTADEAKSGVNVNQADNDPLDFAEALVQSGEVEENVQQKLAALVLNKNREIADLNNDVFGRENNGVSITDLEIFIQQIVDGKYKK